MFASCTSNWWWQMFGFQRYKWLLTRLIGSLQDLPQNLTQSTMLSRVVHVTIVRNLCVMNVRNQSCWSSVASACSCCDCSEPVCMQTRECQVNQSVLNTSIFRGSVSRIRPGHVEVWNFLPSTNVWLPNMHNVPSEVDFESSRFHVKSESWNSPSLHCLAVLHTYNTLCIRMCDGCKISNDLIVCHRPWSTLWRIVQAYLLTIEYQVIQFLPSISIPRQSVSILVISLQLIQALPFLKWWSSKQRLDTVYNCSTFFVCQLAVPVNAFSSMCFHVVGPHYSFCVKNLPPW